MEQSHFSVAFRGVTDAGENYCLAKADVDIALLHKSCGLSIVTKGEPTLVKWEKFHF